MIFRCHVCRRCVSYSGKKSTVHRWYARKAFPDSHYCPGLFIPVIFIIHDCYCHLILNIEFPNSLAASVLSFCVVTLPDRLFFATAPGVFRSVFNRY